MAQIQYTTLTNPIVNVKLVDESGSALTTLSGGVYVIPQVQNESGSYSTVLTDSLFVGALVTIPTDHHEIHGGGSYVASRSVDLGNGASDTVLIIVPDDDTKRYHMVTSYGAELESHFDAYEGATLSATTSATGTPLTSFNRNRNSSNTSALGIYFSPVLASVGGDGTKILEKHAGSGKQVGSETRGNDEIILKNNTKYVLRLTNSTTSNNYVNWELNYYIHPGG